MKLSKVRSNFVTSLLSWRQMTQLVLLSPNIVTGSKGIQRRVIASEYLNEFLFSFLTTKMKLASSRC